MELIGRIDESCVISSLKSSDKNGILAELAEQVYKTGRIDNAEAALSALLEREALGSTGVGEQVAIPHAKLPDLEDIIIVIGVSGDGVDYDASDGIQVRLFFALLSPEKQMNLHLKTLAKISRLVKLTGFKSRILEKELTASEILSILREEESVLG